MKVQRDTNPFFPYMTKIINGFYVYDLEKGFIRYFKNGKKGLCPIALSQTLIFYNVDRWHDRIIKPLSFVLNMT